MRVCRISQASQLVVKSIILLQLQHSEALEVEGNDKLLQVVFWAQFYWVAVKELKLSYHNGYI